MKNILVSTNCNTGGLAACLTRLLPDFKITPFIFNNNQEGIIILIKKLENIDVWITSVAPEIAKGMNVEIIHIPTIYFNAFHPDLCYAGKVDSYKLTKNHYNSKIAVWAFSNGYSINETLKLYTEKNYDSLGYFNAWNSSVENLKNKFIETSLNAKEFEIFMKKIKRKGLFMHTANHPKIEVIVEFAKIIAFRINSEIDLLKSQITIPDPLTQTTWPLYPEIGLNLGLSGNFNYVFSKVDIRGIKNYLEYAFSCYETEGFERDNIKIYFDEINLQQQELMKQELEK